MTCEYVGSINEELLTAVADAPVMEPKDLYVERVLENLFGHHDWAKSFSATQVLIYDEVLPSEILILIHKWLRRKCADIENIILVTTHHLGIRPWWQKWCQINHLRSFQVKEVLFTDSPGYKKGWFASVPSPHSRDFYKHNKKISRLFSFYGNARSGVDVPKERVYATLKMLEFADYAEIDFIGRFPDKQHMIDYVENITYFKNQADIDYISSTYDKYIFSGLLENRLTFLGTKTQNESMTFDGLQWEVDRHCWATVVRETIIDDVYPAVTEKTIRAFLHHMAVIPMAFGAVSELEKLGFWFPHDVIDYSYQHEPLFAVRTQKLIDSLKSVLQNYSYAQLEEYYNHQIDRFHHNTELAYQYINQQDVWLDQLLGIGNGNGSGRVHLP